MLYLCLERNGGTGDAPMAGPTGKKLRGGRGGLLPGDFIYKPGLPWRFLIKTEGPVLILVLHFRKPGVNQEFHAEGAASSGG